MNCIICLFKLLCYCFEQAVEQTEPSSLLPVQVLLMRVYKGS